MNNESPYSQSMMKPALTVIRIFIVLGIISAVVLGFITIVGIASILGYTHVRTSGQEQVVASYGILFVMCLCYMPVALHTPMRCVVFGFDGIDLTQNRKEHAERSARVRLSELMN